MLCLVPEGPLPYLPRRLRQTDELVPWEQTPSFFFSISPLERLFGGSWGDLGAILGALGPSFGALASILAALESILGAFRSILCDLGPIFVNFW